MKNKLHIIGYNFDGVLCDTMPAFQQFWKVNYDWNIRSSITRKFNMDMPKEYDLKNVSDDIATAINDYQNMLYPHAFAMGSVRFLADIFNERPIIITARRKSTTDVTTQWLRKYLKIPFTLVFADGKKKADIIKEWGIKYFVEDRFKVVGELSELCDKVYMVDQVWNAGRDHLVVGRVQRINNLIEVYRDVLHQEGKDYKYIM